VVSCYGICEPTGASFFEKGVVILGGTTLLRISVPLCHGITRSTTFLLGRSAKILESLLSDDR